MPGPIKRFCGNPGCPKVISGAGYCDRHRPKPRPRESSTARQYDYAWQKVRARQLKKEPLCRDCLETGRVTEAIDVHHIVALSKGGPRLDPANLMSLCKPCHSVRTRRGE